LPFILVAVFLIKGLLGYFSKYFMAVMVLRPYGIFKMICLNILRRCHPIIFLPKEQGI
jgi:hypothetical protein